MPIDAMTEQEARQEISRQDREAAAASEREYQAAHPPDPHFEFVTASELASRDCRVDYLISGWLAKGQPCILAGQKKCLKTNFVIDLAVSLATKHKLLDTFYVEEATPTLVMSAESGEGTIQETVRRIGLSKGWAPERIPDLHFSFNVPAIANVEHMGEVKKFIAENGIGCVIIDPTYLAMSSLGDNASNLFAVGNQLRGLTDLSAETGVTIILVHHTSKRSLQYDEPPELDDIAWAGFSEWARQWILLGRRKKYDPDEEGHHELWATAGGSAGHSQGWALNIDEGSIDDDGGRRWDVEVISTKQARYEAAEAASEANEENAEQKRLNTVANRRELILRAFQRHPAGAAKTAIRNSAGMSGTNFQPILDQLIDDNIVQEFKADTGKLHYRTLNGTIATGHPVLSRAEIHY
jgi:hypothetical protein